MTESEIIEMVNGLLPEGYELRMNFNRVVDGKCSPSIHLFFAPNGFDSIDRGRNYRDPSDPSPANIHSIIYWGGVTDFLFGTNIPGETRSWSFFKWLNYRRKDLYQSSGTGGLREPTVRSSFIYIISYLVNSLVSRRPWLLSLDGCSSAEEIELKMAVMGVENVSRKTLEGIEDD